MKKSIIGAIVLGALTLPSATIVFAAPNDESLAIEQKQAQNYLASVKEIATAIEENYPLAPKGASIARAINKAMDQGKFSNMSSDDAFASSMNKVLWEAANDLHLKLYTEKSLAEKKKKQGGRQPKMRRVTVGGDDQKAINGKKGGVKMAPGQSSGPLGITKISSEMLTKDTGLLTITSPIYNNPDVFANALSNVAEAENIIIDLRRTPGGSFPGVQYFSSMFFKEKTHLVSKVFKGDEKPREVWSDMTPHSEHFGDKNIYILTGPRTASGAEHIAYSFRDTGRATLVGERTAGAGNAGAFLPVGKGLQLFLPIMQTLSPTTGLPWEAKGVEPQVKASASDALKVALQSIKEKATMRM